MEIPKGGVAFFDSGVGGLTVLHACQREISGELFYYFGDNTRAPYGNLPASVIRSYVNEAFSVFEGLGVKAVVLACNTATAVCVEELRGRYSFPIVGTEPAVLPAARRGGEVFVLATKATANSVRMNELVGRANVLYPMAKIKVFACEGLAGAIETCIGQTERSYEAHLPQGSPDGVVLGCTHYIFIKERIRRFYGCETFDGNDGVAKRLKNLLFSLKNRTETPFRAGEMGNRRDGRPLVGKTEKKLGKNAHENPLFSVCEEINQKANECSYFVYGNSKEIKGETGRSQICFIGPNFRQNALFYERMFGKGCEVVKGMEKR